MSKGPATTTTTTRPGHAERKTNAKHTRREHIKHHQHAAHKLANSKVTFHALPLHSLLDAHFPPPVSAYLFKGGVPGGCERFSLKWNSIYRPMQISVSLWECGVGRAKGNATRISIRKQNRTCPRYGRGDREGLRGDGAKSVEKWDWENWKAKLSKGTMDTRGVIPLLVLYFGRTRVWLLVSISSERGDDTGHSTRQEIYRDRNGG